MQWHRKLLKHNFLVMTCLEARAVTHTGVWVSMCTLLGDKVGLLYPTLAVVLHHHSLNWHSCCWRCKPYIVGSCCSLLSQI